MAPARLPASRPLGPRRPSRTSRSATSPDKPLIEDLSLSVEPGQTVAIVGPTGAGKTTLVNLLMRFYDVDERPDLGRRHRDPGADARRPAADVRDGPPGRVAVQGHHPREHRLRRRRRGPSEEAFRAAADAAHVDHFVRTLPDGYETVLDDDATNVSAGEKQLLTIARAFLADPPILILDEATSSVDTRTEVLIQRAMATADGGPDVVRHRPPAVDDPRRRHHPRHGRGPDRGAGHARGAARGRGFYHELYASQFEEALGRGRVGSWSRGPGSAGPRTPRIPRPPPDRARSGVRPPVARPQQDHRPAPATRVH